MTSMNVITTASDITFRFDSDVTIVGETSRTPKIDLLLTIKLTAVRDRLRVLRRQLERRQGRHAGKLLPPRVRHANRREDLVVQTRLSGPAC